MHCNCTRTGFEVRVCTASSLDVRKKNSFHKLISVIRIFIRKFFLVQYHPQNIFNIELFLNHGIKNDSVLPKNCLCKMNDRHYDICDRASEKGSSGHKVHHIKKLYIT